MYVPEVSLHVQTNLASVFLRFVISTTIVRTVMTSGTAVSKLFNMLNSVEPEIFPAHKC